MGCYGWPEETTERLRGGGRKATRNEPGAEETKVTRGLLQGRQRGQMGRSSGAWKVGERRANVFR